MNLEQALSSVLGLHGTWLQAIGRLTRHPKANAIMLQVGHEVLWQQFDNLTTPTKAGQKATQSGRI
jgi:hypothetical protein